MKKRMATYAAAMGAALAVLVSLLVAPVGAAPLTPPARVGGLVMTASDYSTVDVAWEVPDSYSLPIDKYVVRVSADAGYTWSRAFDGTSTPQYTLTGLSGGVARLVQVAAVSSDGQGEWSAPLMVTTQGTRTMRVKVVTSSGQPVTGGAITWEMVPRTVWSSVTYGLTADGVIDFPAAPAGTVKVTLINGQLPDGTWVSGRWIATLGFVTTELRLPYVTPAVRRIHVTLPGGLPVSNVRVEVPGLETLRAVGQFNFASPTGSSSGVTDSTGLFTAMGFASGTVQATLTYDDGIIGQEKIATLYSADTNVQLQYAPFVVADAPTASGNVGDGVGVTLSARSAGSALPLTSIKPQAGLSGVKVTLVPPAGSTRGTCGPRLSGVTNARGKVTLRICATKSGLVRVKTAGALPVGTFTLLVRGRPPLPVRSVTAKSKSAGTLSVSWAKPLFAGGARIARYRVEAVTGTGPVLAKDVPVTSSATQLSRTFTGLRHAYRYTVRIYAITKYGWSDPYVTVVPVA